MAEDQFITSFDGTRLFYNPEVTADDKAVCIIVHGLCEHQGRYDYMAQKLHEAGIGTYRFDHRGHGKSEGECAYYSHWDEILDDTNVVVDRAIAENPNRPVFLFGHSMGGYCVALYGVKYPNKNLRGIICNGGLTEDKAGMFASTPTVVDPHTQLPNELGSGVCSVDEVRDWYARDPLNRKTFAIGLVYALKDGLAWFADNKRKFAYPVLLTHGEKDGLISYEDTYDLFAAVASTDKQMKIYGNCYHEVVNEWCRDEVIADYIAWMEHRI
ncbi:alpha/beta hydrolase [Parafannyhessea umbonata]|uniref:alpha/beta hydrolase n=1 Tax=Parafannyhessea umbonata TaxID=604330 RepID=UPI0026EA3775|nr:alpha/beta hydrolase [Parafannyhessea umbonata]MDD7199351.1 lysophospholipase [Parafannyhessea umbonata]MDY4418186.1 alpha/beta hydrolase [Parafannyhessea umbonata]